MTGAFPYGNLQNTFQLIGKILEEDKRPEPMPKDDYGVNTLISRCWIKEASKRPTMNNVVETLQSILQKIKDAEKRPKSLIHNEAESNYFVCL